MLPNVKENITNYTYDTHSPVIIRIGIEKDV